MIHESEAISLVHCVSFLELNTPIFGADFRWAYGAKSDFYCFVTSNENITFIETKKLKELCRKYLDTNRDVKGGDNNTSCGILLPLNEIIL